MTLLSMDQAAQEIGIGKQILREIIEDTPYVERIGKKTLAVKKRHIREIRDLVAQRRERSKQNRSAARRAYKPSLEAVEKLLTGQQASIEEHRKEAAKIIGGEVLTARESKDYAKIPSDAKLWSLMDVGILKNVKHGHFRFVSKASLDVYIWGENEKKEAQRKEQASFAPPPAEAKPPVGCILPTTAPVNQDVHKLVMQVLSVALEGKSITLNGGDLVSHQVQALNKIGEEFQKLKIQNEGLQKAILTKPPADLQKLVDLTAQQAHDLAVANQELIWHKQLTEACVALIKVSDTNQSQAMLNERIQVRRVLGWMGRVK